MLTAINTLSKTQLRAARSEGRGGNPLRLYTRTLCPSCAKARIVAWGNGNGLRGGSASISSMWNLIVSSILVSASACDVGIETWSSF